MPASAGASPRGASAVPDPAWLDPGLLMVLQRLAGNSAVSEAVAAGSAGEVAQRQSAPDASAPEDVHVRIRRAIEHQDYISIPPDSELGAATDEERVQLSDLCISAGYVAPQDASARVLSLWSAMGDRLPAVAGTHAESWERATHFSRRLMSTRFVTDAQGDFHAALRALADGNLADNERFVDDRKKALGVEGGDSLTPDQQADLRHAIQSTAYHAYELRQEQAKMRKLVVGYESSNLGFGEHESSFDPGRPPKYRQTLFSTPPADWDQVKEAWDDAENQIAGIGNDYPELYAAAAADGEGAALLELSRVIPEHFGEQVKQHLLALGDKIREVRGMVASGKLELLDLDLLTQAVLQGQKPPAGRDWSKGFDRWAAKRMLSDRQADRARVQALLESVEVTALVVGTFAGGIGRLVAAGVAVGIAAFQAGQAAVEAGRLEKAATATPLTGTALVSRAQADAKKSEAIARMVKAVVIALIAGASALKVGLRTIRLRALVDDDALLARLRAATQDDALLENLLRKTGDPVTLEQLLGRVPAGQLGPLLERIGSAKLTGSLLERCPDVERLGRLLGRVSDAEQLDRLLAAVAPSDLARLEQVLAAIGDGKPASIAFSIGGELEARAGEVIINPGRAAMSIDRLRTLKPDNLVVGAGAERIPFPDGCGRLISGNKLPNSIDWEAASGEFHRVLAPGGRVEITVFGSGQPLRKALAERGFAVEPPLTAGNRVIDSSIRAVRR